MTGRTHLQRSTSLLRSKLSATAATAGRSFPPIVMAQFRVRISVDTQRDADKLALPSYDRGQARTPRQVSLPSLTGQQVGGLWQNDVTYAPPAEYKPAPVETVGDGGNSWKVLSTHCTGTNPYENRPRYAKKIALPSYNWAQARTPR